VQNLSNARQVIRPQYPQKFQEKKTSKTKQRTPSDKQEKYKNKES